MYKIQVKTIQNNFLTFTVEEYSLIDGFVKFTDLKTNKPKMFHGSNCEIQEVSN